MKVTRLLYKTDIFNHLSAEESNSISPDVSHDCDSKKQNEIDLIKRRQRPVDSFDHQYLTGQVVRQPEQLLKYHYTTAYLQPETIPWNNCSIWSIMSRKGVILKSEIGHPERATSIERNDQIWILKDLFGFHRCNWKASKTKAKPVIVPTIDLRSLILFLNNGIQIGID